MKRHRDRSSARRQGKLAFGIRALGFFLVAWALAPALSAQDEGAAERKREPYWILIEPGQFIVSKPGYPFAGGRRTIARPALTTGSAPGLQPYSENDWKTLRIGWDAFRERAGAAAELRLAELKPRYERDPTSGRALYAEVTMDKPLLAGFLIAPGFSQVFEKELGKRLAVIMPTTTRLFVFSADSNGAFDHGDRLQTLFEKAVYPASREIFLYEKGTMRVVGMLGDEEIQPLKLPE